MGHLNEERLALHGQADEIVVRVSHMLLHGSLPLVLAMDVSQRLWLTVVD